MKSQLSFIAILAIALLTIGATPVNKHFVNSETKEYSPSKQNAGFAFFRTHRQGKNGITSTWGMSSEIGVAGYVLQRTYEDPTDPYSYWEDGCSMPCSSSRSYKWTDENVFPGVINYRVVATMNDGSTIVSEINSIRIVSH